jgi:diadenosine tetraphosphate (Ap4A) HIT family hydrolase
VPAPVGGVIHIEHVIGEFRAETELGFVRLGFELLGSSDRQLHFHILPVKNKRMISTLPWEPHGCGRGKKSKIYDILDFMMKSR